MFASKRFFFHFICTTIQILSINSPSIFNRPSTPQLQSTQFEWTIEEISSLGPANVEAHHSQFHQTPNPEYEAKAQAVIKRYFQNNVIAPSPIACPNRMKKLIHSNDSEFDSPCIRPSILPMRSCKMRDGIAQTELTFPPNLPKEIEDILQSFCTYTDDQQQSSLYHQSYIDHEARDASLRRKLFKTNLDSSSSSCSDPFNIDDYNLDKLSPPPKSPDIIGVNSMTYGRNFGSPGDRSNISLNNSLSPVRVNGVNSPKLSPINFASSTQCFYRKNENKLVGINTNELSNDNKSDDEVHNGTSTPNMKHNELDSDNNLEVLGNQHNTSSMISTPVRKNKLKAVRKNLSHSFHLEDYQNSDNETDLQNMIKDRDEEPRSCLATDMKLSWPSDSGYYDSNSQSN